MDPYILNAIIENVDKVEKYWNNDEGKAVIKID